MRQIITISHPATLLCDSFIIYYSFIMILLSLPDVLSPPSVSLNCNNQLLLESLVLHARAHTWPPACAIRVALRGTLGCFELLWLSLGSRLYNGTRAHISEMRQRIYAEKKVSANIYIIIDLRKNQAIQTTWLCNVNQPVFCSMSHKSRILRSIPLGSSFEFEFWTDNGNSLRSIP